MVFTYKPSMWNGKLLVKTSYHSFFPAFARSMGGRYSRKLSAWVFDGKHQEMILKRIDEYQKNAEQGLRPVNTL